MLFWGKLKEKYFFSIYIETSFSGKAHQHHCIDQELKKKNSKFPLLPVVWWCFVFFKKCLRLKGLS